MKHNPTLTAWLTALTSTATAGAFVKASLTQPTPKADDLKSIDIRPILVKREPKLSFTYHHKTRDIVKNYTADESTAVLAKLLVETFTLARLYTLGADFHLTKQAKGFNLTENAPTQTAAPSLAHDKPKQRPLSTAKPYLHALGLTDEGGNVLKSAQDKFRQINKYIEILDGLVKQLPQHQLLRLADMGSGKGYLTFALYDHLTSTLGLNVELTGVEYRQDMVTLCNTIAQQNGFTGLRFVQGAIESYDCTGTHVIIALHACDTATDDALFKAVSAHAELIVVAPCCHKQLRPQLKTAPAPLQFLMKYGTYADRLAEMVTDGLRTQLLEASGYNTNLFEFISDAHTPKNVMIVATKLPTPRKPAETTALLAAIAQTKSHFQIQTQKLEQLLSLKL